MQGFPIDTVVDTLYGIIPFTSDQLKLFQTREFARLRQVSLSAVPTWTIAGGICATKAEHSIGVAHLSTILARKKEFRSFANDLYIASLAHDIGTPPFSHLSETFLKKLLNKNHEEFAEDVLDGSEFANVAKKQNVSIERVLNLITGKEKPLSDVINGTIDLDNLDNSLRYGRSVGLFQNQLYDPQIIVKAFVLKNNEIALKTQVLLEVRKWEHCRKVVYNFVYAPLNLAGEALIWRAIYLAVLKKEIKKSYFFLTDAQAQDYLENKCNNATRQLVKNARLWKYYSLAYSFNTTTPSQTFISFLKDDWNRGVIADTIASRFRMKAEHVSVFLRKSRAHRKIHLSFVDAQEKRKEHIPIDKAEWIAQVYIHPDCNDKISRIQEYMDGLLK